jgi:hypothetical protein
MMNINRGKNWFFGKLSFRRVLTSALLVLNVSGCSTYGSSFSCGDSRGATCLPMDKVDQLINSGAIETYTNDLAKNKKHCGAKCQKTKLPRAQQPLQNIDNIDDIKMIKGEVVDVRN